MKNFIVFLLVCLAVPLYASDAADRAVSGAIDATRRDIAKEMKGLDLFRRRAALSRVRLAAELSKVENRVLALQADLKLLKSRRVASDGELQQMQLDSAAMEALSGRVMDVLYDAHGSLFAGFGPAFRQEHRAALSDVEKRLADALKQADMVPPAAGAMLGLACLDAEQASMVRVVKGVASGPDGRQAGGRFICAGGAVILFADRHDGTCSGLVSSLDMGEFPAVRPVSVSAAAAIRKLADGSDTDVPIDIVESTAATNAKHRVSLWNRLYSGGVIMIPIGLVALAGMMAGIGKTVQLLRIPVNFEQQLNSFETYLRKGQFDRAADAAGSARPPVRTLMLKAIANRGASRETLEEIFYEVIISEVPRLERYMSVLSVGAAAAPLLGLLGTVTGMIHTFNLISIHGTGDAKLLSGGISEALVTTQAGLVTAVPLLIIHAFLARRIRVISDALEKNAIALINNMTADVSDGEDE